MVDMSRVGKLPIEIPVGVEVCVNGRTVSITGPKGSLYLDIAEQIGVSVSDGKVLVSRSDDSRTARALHGLTRALIANNVHGVLHGYTKTLEIVGTGYRVSKKGENLELALGFSHPVIVDPVPGVSFGVEGNSKIIVSGIDKQAVGEAAASIRKLSKPEPYKGKGIRYSDEIVRRKVGKAGK